MPGETSQHHESGRGSAASRDATTELRAATTETPWRGLSKTEAAARLVQEGPNALPEARRRTLIRIVSEVLREPMLALLVGGGAIYLALGDVRDALVLIVFAMLSVVITVVQEVRTERVLEALRELASPRAEVVRAGVRRRVAGREVVRGDILVLAEGDRIAADAVVREALDLKIDELALTGESVAVHKQPASGEVPATVAPGGDGGCMVYAGTLIVRGQGFAEVTATGVRSELGRIGASLQRLETGSPRLRVQAARLVRMMAVAGVAVSSAAVLLYGWLRGGWLEALLAGIAIGMSMLPEELPVILMVFLAMGAWRISRVRVLTRRAAAIETLGAATVLCTDKTGTLTQNRMSVAELWMPERGSVPCAVDEATTPGMTDPGINGARRALAQLGRQASSPYPFDPMERAFHELADATGVQVDGAGRLLRVYPLRPELLAMVQVWENGTQDAPWNVAAKGAPEAIADLCALDAAQRMALRAEIDRMARAGRRVLGLARARADGSALPDSAWGFAFEFAGIAGLADPLRDSVPQAIRHCRKAGIRVVMITGDYPETARAIAREAGLDSDQVVTGGALSAMSDAALADAVRRATVFARIQPHQKLRIVNALKAQGEIVAMTGDGVNDAPSLKAAHIGIAMGQRGTDVAREASAIVLLDDDFSAIVAAIALGRRIHDNIRKAIGFVFAVHVPIAGMALLPLALGLPVVLSPVHIAFLEMVIDPVCSLVFEAEKAEEDVMARPPRPAQQPLFSAPTMAWSLVQGIVAFVFTGGVYLLAARSGLPETEARALTFFSLLTAILALIMVNRSLGTSLRLALDPHNPVLLVVLAAVAGVSTVSLLWLPARELFRFGPLHTHDAAITLMVGAGVLLLLEMLKAGWRRSRAL